MSEVGIIKGLSDLQKLLDTLPAKVEQNIMRGALRAGIKPVKKEAQHLLAAHGNVKTRVLSEGLKVSARARRGVVTASVKLKGKHAFVGYWLEYTGAKAHEIKPKSAKSLLFAGLFQDIVQHPGFKAQPFMRPALDSRAQVAVVAAAEYMKKRLATKEGLDTADIDIEAQP